MSIELKHSPVGAQDSKQGVERSGTPAFTRSGTPLIIAGPCSVESEDQIMATAQTLAKIPEVKNAPWRHLETPHAPRGF